MLKTCFLLLLLGGQVSLKTFFPYYGANAGCRADFDCLAGKGNQCCLLPRRGKRSTFRFGVTDGVCIELSNVGQECFVPGSNEFPCPRCSFPYVCEGTGVIVVPQGERGVCRMNPVRGK